MALRRGGRHWAICPFLLHRRDPWRAWPDKFDKAYEDKAIEELASAPVSALQGVSDGDAEHLKAAFNIKTVKDLGTNKFFLWAQAVAKLAE